VSKGNGKRRDVMPRLGYVLSLIGVVVLVGCAPGRVADLRDSGRLSFGIGAGLAVDAKAGPLTHPSLGTAYSSAKVGFESRDVHGAFYEVGTSDPHAAFWAKRHGASLGQALNSSGWRAAYEVHEYEAAIIAVGHPHGQDRPEILVTEIRGEELDGILEEKTWLPFDPDLSFTNATDLQVGATALLVSARAGFNTLEFLDFLLGFVGLDIAGDDVQ
jgi:hypothetical protein